MGAAIAKDWASPEPKCGVLPISMEEGIASVVEEIRAAGGSATHIVLDVTSEEQAKAAVAHVVAEFGEINLLLNNAGSTSRRFSPTPRRRTTTIMA